MKIQKQQFPISATDSRAGILMTPDDFATNSEPCPLIVFSHGVGEAGDGTLNTLDALYNNGSPLAQARDLKLSSIICPITGKSYRPVVFGLQGTGGWCVRPADTVYAIQQLLKQYPQIDASAIMITGLSAGGENTFEMAGGPNASLFCAAWPMSTPAINTGIVNWNILRARAWVTHGKYDTGPTDYYNSVRTVDAINAVKKGYAFLTTTNDGHNNWANIYVPTFRVAMPGVAGGKPINGYEFLLACKNSQVSFTSSGTAAGTSVTNTESTGIVTTALATVSAAGNTVTLDGSKSTAAGGFQSSSWFIGDAKTQAYVKPQSIISGGMDLGKGVVPNAVITLLNGEYFVRLTVQDPSGKQSVITVPLVVGSAPAGPTIVLTFTVNGKTYTLYSDNTWK
jgi:hypothetical protein